MKEAELRENSICGICNKKIGESGYPFFHRITLESFAIDLGAIKRHDGLATFLQSPTLANVMGTNEDLAREIDEPKKMAVCQTCWVECDLPLAAIAEDR